MGALHTLTLADGATKQVTLTCHSDFAIVAGVASGAAYIDNLPYEGRTPGALVVPTSVSDSRYLISGGVAGVVHAMDLGPAGTRVTVVFEVPVAAIVIAAETYQIPAFDLGGVHPPN